MMTSEYSLQCESILIIETNPSRTIETEKQCSIPYLSFNKKKILAGHNWQLLFKHLEWNYEDAVESCKRGVLELCTRDSVRLFQCTVLDSSEWEVFVKRLDKAIVKYQKRGTKDIAQEEVFDKQFTAPSTLSRKGYGKKVTKYHSPIAHDVFDTQQPSKPKLTKKRTYKKRNTAKKKQKYEFVNPLDDVIFTDSEDEEPAIRILADGTRERLRGEDDDDDEEAPNVSKKSRRVLLDDEDEEINDVIDDEAMNSGDNNKQKEELCDSPIPSTTAATDDMVSSLFPQNTHSNTCHSVASVQVTDTSSHSDSSMEEERVDLKEDEQIEKDDSLGSLSQEDDKVDTKDSKIDNKQQKLDFAAVAIQNKKVKKRSSSFSSDKEQSSSPKTRKSLHSFFTPRSTSTATATVTATTPSSVSRKGAGVNTASNVEHFGTNTASGEIKHQKTTTVPGTIKSTETISDGTKTKSPKSSNLFKNHFSNFSAKPSAASPELQTLLLEEEEDTQLYDKTLDVYQSPNTTLTKNTPPCPKSTHSTPILPPQSKGSSTTPRVSSAKKKIFFTKSSTTPPSQAKRCLSPPKGYVCDDGKETNHVTSLTLFKKISPKKISNATLNPYKTVKKVDYGIGGGLRNLGNTCYMNAALQALFSCSSFISNLSQLDARNSTKEHESTGMQNSSLLEMLHSLAKSMNRLPTQDTLPATTTVTTAESLKGSNPAPLKKVMDSLTSRFVGYSQQDSHEFLSVLIDLLHEEAEAIKNDSKTTISTKTVTATTETPNNIADNLCLEVQVSLTCNTCSYTRSKTEMYRHLSLDMSSSSSNENHQTSLKQSINAFFQPEKREISCEKCKTGSSATQTMKVKKLPKVLVLHLKRFIMVDSNTNNGLADDDSKSTNSSAGENSKRDEVIISTETTTTATSAASPSGEKNVGTTKKLYTPTLHKNQSRVEFGTVLSMSSYCDTPKNEQSTPPPEASSGTYKLRSVVHHIGKTPFSGHYTTDACLPTCASPTAETTTSPVTAARWVRLDDQHGKIINVEQDVVKNDATQREAYMVLYELENE
mmetsp:Transcript_9995/g.11464  ORF Transcript_9995/g.11464 Transcript_9995/m.11464 type:complete len:1049 (-) Transcript_9995:481-3627(-)